MESLIAGKAGLAENLSGEPDTENDRPACVWGFRPIGRRLLGRSHLNYLS